MLKAKLKILMVAAAPAWATSQVQVRVQLSPAGSFEATSAAINGQVVKEAKGYSAENLTIPLGELKTGIELRDNHMKNKYLEVEKYPVATIKKAQGHENGAFSGEIEIHGVTKPVTGTYKVEGDALKAEFTVKMSDFNIEKARYMGIGAKDEVKIESTIPIRVASAAPTPAKLAPAATSAKKR